MGPFVMLLIVVSGVAGVVILTTKLRVNAFLSLLCVAIVVGLLLGLAPSSVVDNVVGGFGDTVGYVGLIILASTIIAELLNKTGATTVVAKSLLNFVNKSKLCCKSMAVGLAGYLVAAPVQCNDTAFLILSPFASTFGRMGRFSATLVSLILAAGAYTSYKLIYPAAPLYAATIFHADIGSVLLLGFLVSLPVFAAGVVWAQLLERRAKGGSSYTASSAKAEKPISHHKLPSTLESYLMLILPVVLILAKAFLDGFLSESNPLRSSLDFLGHPVIAMLIGVGFCLWVARHYPKEKVSEWISSGITRAAPLIAIVGAGGVLGKILLQANLGTVLGSSLVTTGVPGAIVVFLIAAIIKTAQGSSTVTMVTAPTILLPLLPVLGLSPALATLLVCAGAMVSLHINDSFFWIVTGFSRQTVAQGLRGLTSMSIIQGLTALLVILVIRTIIPTL